MTSLSIERSHAGRSGLLGPLGGALLALSLLCASGCRTMGPATIEGARFDYNDAIIKSFDHQMLLNLVRLRYQDSIFFLDLSSVVASYRRDVSASVAPNGTVSPTPGFGWGASAGGSYGETPTISYVPLQGEDFAKRLLAPIQPSAILLLSRSGWGFERLFLCTVQQLNELLNGSAIGGVAPKQVRHYTRFQRVARLLRELQEDGFIQLNTLAEAQGSVALTAGPIQMDEAAEAKAAEIKDLLKLSGSKTHEGAIPLEAPSFPRSPAQVELTGRSFLGVMTFLAQHIDLPEPHVRAGLVRVALGPDGKPFDWRQISQGLFRVHSGVAEPKAAYLKVQYRDYWFWIDDADLDAKGTYTLLAQLFSLQAATGRIQGAPVLTIPAR